MTRWFKLLLVAALALITLVAQPGAAQAQELRPATDDHGLIETLEPAPPLPDGYFTVHGLYADVRAHPDDARVAHRLADHAAVAVPEIAARLGVGAGRPMIITLAHQARDFSALQPGHPPDWADGTAWPHRSLIFLRAPRLRPGTSDPLEQVLDHEIVHVLLGQAFGPRPVPRWLQEGLAQVVAGEYGPETIQTIARGSLGGGLLGLEDIERGFPVDAVRANLAYAQSADLIAFLTERHGDEVIPALVKQLAAGRPMPAAFRAVTGDDAQALDRAWRARLNDSPLRWTALAQGEVLLGLSSFGLFFGFLGARRRNRDRLARWDEEEALRDATLRGVAGWSAPGR